MRFRSLKITGCVAIALVSFSGASAGVDPAVLDAVVIDAAFPPMEGSYPTIDFGRSPKAGDDRTGTTEWAVYHRTGNCCENYLTSNSSGRLYDFGGSYINFTDNRGKSWKQVRPITPLVNGEGAIAMAPGGDVVGVEWDPYSGDHLLAFKYDASDKKWVYAEMPVHAPFYDREWIAAVPGPFTIDGQKVPYISFIKGAWPSKEAWFYSTDGINYHRVSSKFVDHTISSAQGPRSILKTVGRPDMDWIQPNTNAGLYPLGGGSALASPDVPFSGGDWSVLDPKTQRWEAYRPDGKRPQGRFQVDSAGRLHNVISKEGKFVYRISTDAGRSWKSATVPLPRKHAIEEIDFRANRKVGIAAVAIHGHDSAKTVDKDMLFKIDISSNTPRAMRYYQVGLADVNGSSGVGAGVRFDFETVTILPDGRVAMSFYDTTTASTPALAIEGETNLR